MNPADDLTALSNPPRHAIESDSEEDDDPAFPRPPRNASSTSKASVEIRVSGWEGEKDSLTLVVIGGEEAGKFADGFEEQEAGQVLRVDGGKEEVVSVPAPTSGLVLPRSSKKLTFGAPLIVRSACCRACLRTSSCWSSSLRFLTRFRPLLRWPSSRPSRPLGTCLQLHSIVQGESMIAHIYHLFGSAAS